jgi:hypothetical protein
MKTKHTPGPWISSSYGFNVLGDNQRVSVCQLDGKQSQVVKEANAKLIAAAPDLLNACNEALNFIMPEAAFNILNNAIKKATE